MRAARRQVPKARNARGISAESDSRLLVESPRAALQETVAFSDELSADSAALCLELCLGDAGFLEHLLNRIQCFEGPLPSDIGRCVLRIAPHVGRLVQDFLLGRIRAAECASNRDERIELPAVAPFLWTG